MLGGEALSPTSRVRSVDFLAACNDLQEVCARMARDRKVATRLQRAIEICVQSLQAGGTIFFCGNGGSAADSQHLAGELVSRFLYDRPGLRGIALNADTAVLTAIGNDYGYDRSLSRPFEAQARPGDVLVALSTSGRSPNVIAALRSAAVLGVHTIGLTGRDGGEMAEHCQIELRVPSQSTPRIQEVHLLLGHLLCEGIESRMFRKNDILL
jgi:D-sedoheptulose 7-phosphate isomerase